MKKNRRGFTLTELLASIVIIGVLLALVIPATSSFVGKGKVKYYQGLENNIRIALQDYMLDYRSLLPREIGEIASVTSEELIDNNYIDEIVDEKKNVCDFNLAVEKTSKQKYEYYVCLKCGDYYKSDDSNCDISNSSDTSSKTFTIMLNDDFNDKVVPQCSSLNIPTASVFQNIIKDTENGQETEVRLVTDKLFSTPRTVDTKVLGQTTLKYIYRHTTKSFTVTVDDQVNPEITSSLITYVDGSEYNMTNSDGSVNAVNGKLSVTVNSQDLACSKNDATCSSKCSKVNGSGIKSIQYKSSTSDKWNTITPAKLNHKFTLTESVTGTLQMRVVDKYDNTSATIEKKVYMDNNAPSKTTVKYLGGSNTCSWKNNYKLQLEATDDVAIAYFEVDYDNNGISDNTISGDIITSSDNISSIVYIPPNNFNYHYVRFRAVDVAGNRGEWSSKQHIHMDTEVPSKATVSLGNYTSSSWTNTDVTQTYNATDNVGVNLYEYSYDKQNIVGSTSKSWTLTTDGQYTIYARAVDKAGNRGVWSDSYTIKRDTVKPNCELAITNNPTSFGEWYTSAVQIGFLNSSDNVGQTTTSISSSYLNNSSLDLSGTVVTGTVKDQAGNTKTCTLTVKIDATSPRISAKVSELYVSTLDYDLKDNVNTTFGPLGGSVSCTKLRISLNGSTATSYEVTCTATGNNGKSASAYYYLILDDVEPTITAKKTLVNILKNKTNYAFTSNVTVTYGPAGGTTTCTPATSLGTGRYDVTCTATGNNGKSASVSFEGRHYFAATEKEETTYWCKEKDDGDNCCVWNDAGNECQRTPNNYPGAPDCCDTRSSTTTVYSCPNKTDYTLSGSNCYYK